MNRIGEKYCGTDYQNKRIVDFNFKKCKFLNCNLTNTLLDDCLIEDCTFENCDLTMIKIEKTIFRNVSFENCKMLGIVWNKSQTKAKLSFKNSIISYSNFSDMKLPGIKILDCIAEEVVFSETDLKNADLRGSNFKNSIFHNACLFKTNFTNAINYNGIDLSNPKTKGAIFSLPEAIILFNNFDIEIV